MAITFKELNRLIRFKTKDFNETRFSDFEIRESINECLRYFNGSYALRNSDFLEKIKIYDEEEMNSAISKQEEVWLGDELVAPYDFKNTGVELPSDFITLQSVMRLPDGYIMSPTEGIKTPEPWEYKVTGDRLYLGSPSAKVLYRAGLQEFKESSGEIDAPNIFKDAIAKGTVMILESNAETDVLMEAFDDMLSSIVPRRRYANAHIRMPFKV
jgi:hypothetical protein|nr:MAG TPA: hypothetical protein [Caudoviricetes sp.]